ncbi:ribonuclease toxin HepT-like protein [Chthoniobacter flavus]|nr:hypothetical protein [Chthoniobacter flavus]
MPLETSALRGLAAILAEDLLALRRLDGALKKFSAEIVRADWDSADLWASAGVLHGIYNAIENTFLRVSNTLDESLERSERWHAELLQLMLLDVPNLRPAFVSAELQPLLKELLAFRHLYRHGYDLRLDGVRLNGLIEHWNRDKDLLFSAFESFHSYLIGMAESLSR